MHHVFLALDAHLASGLRGGHRTGLDQVDKMHHLGLDEALLEVGVDHARGLGRCGTLADGPRARLLGARRQVGLQSKRVEADASKLIEPGLVLAVGLEHLASLFFREVHQLGFEFGIKEDAVRRRDLSRQRGLRRRIGEPCVVRIENVDERLGRQQVELPNIGKVELGGRSSS